MRAYKFLDRNGRAIYSGASWPLPAANAPGAWMETEHAVPCHVGIHGCRPSDLSYWLGDNLFELELDGDVVEARHKVVARRGRLVRRIDDYTMAARELCAVVTWRARDVALTLLESSPHSELANAFRAATTLDEIEALGAAVGDSFPTEDDVGLACGMAVDSAHFAHAGEAAVHSPFIAACAVGHANAISAPNPRQAFDEAFNAERREQSGWLADRLSLV
jgi:hypothetical protein